ncbi:regulatory protein [Nostoc sp. HK-01]|nr:regulatory protein [Nostoc sp. HK-01]
MPRKTYGPEIQKRVKRLLAALLCFAAREVEEDKFKIEYDWKEEDSVHPKLTIKTTLVTLELLTQEDEHPGKLTKTQIREALNLLKDFVKILEDNRIQTKGSDNWHFTLKLWSRDREKNLKRFDEVWESNRPNKSKLVNPLIFPPSLQGKGARGLGQIQIFQAPPLPIHFVERPEYSNDLKTRLLTSNQTLVITAIHGLGSVGKSTLAAALAYDAEIQTRFCDGILWATLGQQPDVLSLLSGWVQALGDYSFKPTSVEATVSQLRTLLYDKAVLLVVDDAWNTQDAQAFNVGGARCQVLVTTRDEAIADALAARIYNLDIMTDTQAMELLTKKLGREITGKERQSAANLAEDVGYLPLALELAAAEVASGTTWDELLADIRQEIARLRSFDRPEAEEITDEASLKRLSLTASLNLSVKRMPPIKQQHFAWLGVLPEDVTINKMMAATLWEMDERDAAKMLQYLQRKALLLTGVPLADSTPTYRLHDLFHDLACNFLTAPLLENPSPNLSPARREALNIPPFPTREGGLGGLGFNLADAHAAFLEKYRQKTQDNLWHTLPNDGYIHQHLVWHLEKAGQIEQIHQLLREESATGNNGWYEVRERLAQTGGYITDISRAWELAEANWTESTLPQIVSLQCRYGLITASLNSLAANLPVDLLVALVKNKLWTAEQGLAYALQKPEPEEKVKALAELVNYLPPNLEKLVLLKALVAAREIQDEYYRADALSALAEKLPPDLLPEALAAARAIQDEYYRADALSALASKLPEILPEALAAARAMQYEQYHVQTLSALTDILPEMLPEKLVAAKAIQDEYSRADTLSALVDKLPEILPEALTAAKTIRGEANRAVVLRKLADKLPPELIAEALTTARAIENEQYRADALTALADKLPPELIAEALTTARAIENEQYRADALTALADKLPPELIAEALTTARAKYEIYRAYTLRKLADKLPSELLPEVLAVAREIQDEYSRANALIALADKLPEVLPEALAAARSVQNKRDCTIALIALTEKLPEILPEALAAARAIPNEYVRAYFLSELTEKLPEVLPEALTAAREIQDESDRVYVLTVLADKLPEVLPEALAAARAIQDEYYRANALSALADKLTEVLSEALTTAREIQDEYYRADALSALADKLPPELLAEALSTAKVIQSEYSRASALSALASSLSQMPFSELFLLWQETIHYLSLRTRSNLLSDIKALFPVIFALGGEAATAEVARAIIDVTRWWR